MTRNTPLKTLSCGAIVALLLTLTPVAAASAEETGAPAPEVIADVQPTTAPALVASESTSAQDDKPTPAATATPESAPVATATPEPAPVVGAAPSVEVAPVAVEKAPEAAAAAGIPAPLISTDGLKPIGTGVHQPTQFDPRVEYQRYLPQVRTASISGYARPEGAAAPDEVTLDLRSLVGVRNETPSGTTYDTGFRYAKGGALAYRPDTGEYVPVAGFFDRIAWGDFVFDVEPLDRTGIASNTTSADGKVRLVAFDANSTYGVKVTLRHIATGVTSDPVTITGKSGVTSGSPFDWVSEAPARTATNGIGSWKAKDKAEWRNGHNLTWDEPAETVAPADGTSVTPNTVGQAPGETGDTTVPGGFGLTRHENGTLQAGLTGELPSYRVGLLTGEPTKTVTIDLATRIPDATAVAIASAENGTLSLAATGGLWKYNERFVGLDYNAPEGLTVSVAGSTVTFDFGSAEWQNAAGIVVPVLLADGTRVLAEVRTESLPRDITGGLVEKQIPTGTALFISDEEMLAASRLTGLSPSKAEVQGVSLPEGVSRVANGFEYSGSAAPTTLSFGFTVAETVSTEFGLVKPDAAGPGEVRIAVVAAETPVTPTTPEQPKPETPGVTPPQPQAKPPVTDAPTYRWETGDDGSVTAARNVTTESGNGFPVLPLAAAGGLGVLGLVALLFARLRRRATQ